MPAESSSAHRPQPAPDKQPAGNARTMERFLVDRLGVDQAIATEMRRNAESFEAAPSLPGESSSSVHPRASEHPFAPHAALDERTDPAQLASLPGAQVEQVAADANGVTDDVASDSDQGTNGIDLGNGASRASGLGHGDASYVRVGSRGAVYASRSTSSEGYEGKRAQSVTRSLTAAARARLMELDQQLRGAIERFDQALASFEATPASDADAVFAAGFALDRAESEMDAINRAHSLAMGELLLTSRMEIEDIQADLAQLKRAWSPLLDDAGRRLSGDAS